MKKKMVYHHFIDLKKKEIPNVNGVVDFLICVKTDHKGGATINTCPENHFNSVINHMVSIILIK
jgi:hypothetical protein